MPRSLPHVHCELGPVLVNRTAVYKMCKALPQELVQRGFPVSCSALLARLGVSEVEPADTREQRWFDWSRRWLHWACSRPGLFQKTHWATAALPRWRHRRGIRLFLDPLYWLFYGAPKAGVVLVYDITPVSDPGWHGPGVARLYEEALDGLARSDCHLIASCQNTADQLRVNWGIAPSSLTVLPLGLFAFTGVTAAPAPATSDPFLLFVGSLEPRKNVAGLVQAYAASGLYAERGIRLRLIGTVLAPDHPVAVLARATPGVDVLGFVEDGILAAAYARCLAFVYPSFCEGFGLPLLEAMHRGCVCLSTRTGASPEIAGDAALYVNPYAPAEIARGLRRVVELTPTERRQLSTRARERARTFTWPRFYDGLARVLEAVAAA
jgi:glycosyltransferase involved in cell wall biosynthesis